MSLTDIQTQISSDCDCFVCVISTHGGEDPGFYANSPQEPGYTKTEHYVLNNEGALWTRHIMEKFNDQHCKALRGKPRLFFVQVHVYVNAILFSSDVRCFKTKCA